MTKIEYICFHEFEIYFCMNFLTTSSFNPFTDLIATALKSKPQVTEAIYNYSHRPQVIQSLEQIQGMWKAKIDTLANKATLAERSAGRFARQFVDRELEIFKKKLEQENATKDKAVGERSYVDIGDKVAVSIHYRQNVLERIVCGEASNCFEQYFYISSFDFGRQVDSLVSNIHQTLFLASTKSSSKLPGQLDLHFHLAEIKESVKELLRVYCERKCIVPEPTKRILMSVLNLEDAKVKNNPNALYEKIVHLFKKHNSTWDDLKGDMAANILVSKKEIPKWWKNPSVWFTSQANKIVQQTQHGMGVGITIPQDILEELLVDLLTTGAVHALNEQSGLTGTSQNGASPQPQSSSQDLSSKREKKQAAEDNPKCPNISATTSSKYSLALQNFTPEQLTEYNKVWYSKLESKTNEEERRRVKIFEDTFFQAHPGYPLYSLVDGELIKRIVETAVSDKWRDMDEELVLVVTGKPKFQDAKKSTYTESFLALLANDPQDSLSENVTSMDGVVLEGKEEEFDLLSESPAKSALRTNPPSFTPIQGDENEVILTQPVQNGIGGKNVRQWLTNHDGTVPQGADNSTTANSASDASGPQMPKTSKPKAEAKKTTDAQSNADQGEDNSTANTSTDPNGTAKSKKVRPKAGGKKIADGKAKVATSETTKKRTPGKGTPSPTNAADNEDPAKSASKRRGGQAGQKSAASERRLRRKAQEEEDKRREEEARLEKKKRNALARANRASARSPDSEVQEPSPKRRRGGKYVKKNLGNDLYDESDDSTSDGNSNDSDSKVSSSSG